ASPPLLPSFPTRRSSDLRFNWPARYRLDALLPASGREVNLSHLLLGHGGDLVWIEWLIFSAIPAESPERQAQPFSARNASDAGLDRKSTRLNSSHLIISY